MNIFVRRAAGSASVVAALVGSCGLILESATPASAIDAIHTTAAVNIRPTPNTSESPLGVVPPSTTPDYLCFTFGQVIGGVPVWMRVQYQGVTGYISSYYDDSSYSSSAELTAKYGITECGVNPAGSVQPAGSSAVQPAAGSTTVQPAAGSSALSPATQAAQATSGMTRLEAAGVAWAWAHKGAINTYGADPWSATWSGECLVFVWDAFSRSIPTRPTAYEDYLLFRSQGRVSQGPPPAGSIVWFGGANGFGHVAVGIGGGGYIVGTHGWDGQSLPVSVDYYSSRGLPYLGWSWPDR